MIRPYVSHVFTLIPHGPLSGSDADSVFVFGCPTMGRESMTTAIRDMIPGSRSVNAVWWFQKVPEEYRTLVTEACKAAFEEIGFLQATHEDILRLVLEWHRQIWLTVAREGLA